MFNFAAICSKYGCRKEIRKTLITVYTQDQKVVTETTETNLPWCHEGFFKNRFEKPISGYFLNGKWNTLFCKSIWISLEQTRTCLKNKVIYFIGDSTIRQFFYLFVQTLNLKAIGPYNSVIWQQPKVAYDVDRLWHSSSNTTLYYRAHGPPLLNPGPPNTRPYISDLIADIPVGGDDVYVVFNIGAHLLHYNPNMYIHRLKGIRKAIIKHHQQNPGTKFIVRGLNVVEIVFEWNIFRFEKILFEMFKNLANVIFLNLWDLTTVWPLDNYHPYEHVLDQQALFLMKFLCI